jgi:hypothetical protein
MVEEAILDQINTNAHTERHGASSKEEKGVGGFGN